MNKKRWAGAGAFLVVAGYLTLAFYAGGMMAEGIIQNNSEKFERGYWWVSRMGGQFMPLVKQLPELLDNKTYIVLLQNNTELRPTGGFMGSYAKLKFIKGGLAEMTVKDIYDPDGLLQGHVEPPLPIQEAFGQGWWRLRDSNWDLDYPTAAKTIDWFFEHGSEKGASGIVAVNMGLIQRWIGIVGGVNPTTREEKITANNFYSIAQKEAEYEWYPGSTQKRDFLGATGTALVEKTKDSTWLEKHKLVKEIIKELQTRQILVWLKDEAAQKEIERIGWDGKLQQPKDREDYLYIAETNLGANKANCCIQRKVLHYYIKNGASIEINWHNENKSSTPDKINTWGGDYIDYVRVATRKDNKIIGIKVNDRDLRFEIGNSATPSSLTKEKNMDVYRIEDRGGLQIIGFWAIAKAQGDVKAEIQYQPVESFKSVLVKRQPGIESFSYKATKNKLIKYEGEIKEDSTIKL